MRHGLRSRTGRVSAALVAAASFAALPSAVAIAIGALSLAPAGGASGRSELARNGEIAFIRKSNFYGEGVLHAVDPSTRKVRRLLKSGWIRDADWSPDGKRLAIVDKCAIKIMPAAGGRLRTILRPRKTSGSDGSHGTECYATLDWSPDGRELVFARCGDPSCESGPGPVLYTVGTSGRGLRQLTQRDCVVGRVYSCLYVGDYLPSWSPDGKKILFQRLDVSLPDPPHGNWANNARLYVVNPDGSGLERLPPEQARSPEWSPDGSRIAFTRIVWTTLPPGAISTASLVVVNPDGSGEKTLVQGDSQAGCSGWAQAWAPDASKLAYSGPCPRGIYTMSPDGSDRVRLTLGKDRLVSWRPLP